MSSPSLRRCTDAKFRVLCRHWLYNSFHVSARSASDTERSGMPGLGGPTPIQKGKTLSELQLGGAQKRTRKSTKTRREVEGPSIAQNSKVQQYLADLESTNGTVVLADIERYRPSKPADSKYSSYDDKYKEIHQSLIQSFTVSQFRDFFNLYELPLPPIKQRTKVVLAEGIMKKWGWETVAKVKEERLDRSETSECQFPLDVRESFLFVGKDGTDLLNLAKRYNVHLSFTSNPLTLKVQGLRGSVKQVEGYLQAFKTDIISETTYLPLSLKITSEIAQSISRVSGTYVETEEDGKLCITYLRSRPDSVESVKRFAIQAACEQLGSSSAPISFVSGDLEAADSFSLYPFFPSQITSTKLQSNSSFRLRQVGQWIYDGSHNSDEGAPFISNLSNLGVKEHLMKRLSNVTLKNPYTVVTASAGHLLFLSEQTTLVPPLTGSIGKDDILQWAKSHSHSVLFNESIPTSLLTSVPHKERQVHRLVYKAHEQEDQSTSLGFRRFLTMELPKKPLYQDSEVISVTDSTFAGAVCYIGVEACMHILVPKRTTDIQMYAAKSEKIPPSQFPQTLKEFIDQMQGKTSFKLAEIPLMITFDGLPYILNSSSEIRQRYHKIFLQNSKEEGISKEANLLVETTIDPENDQNVVISKLVCEDIETEWQDFLSQCEYLTRMDKEVPKISQFDMPIC